MTDYTELQRAAEYAAQDVSTFADEDEEMRALQKFHEEVDPEMVLALIAENKAMAEFKAHMVGLRETHGFDSWAAVLVEFDRLKAENESLRKDAERYRWIRKPGVNLMPLIDSMGQDMDKGIDDDIAKAKGDSYE